MPPQQCKPEIFKDDESNIPHGKNLPEVEIEEEKTVRPKKFNPVLRRSARLSAAAAAKVKDVIEQTVPRRSVCINGFYLTFDADDHFAQELANSAGGLQPRGSKPPENSIGLRAPTLSVLYHHLKRYEVILFTMHLRKNAVRPYENTVAFKDQVERAKECVRLCVRSGCTTIRFMDGHGRMLLLLLEQLLREVGAEAMNNYVLELVEKDCYVSQWHRSMYQCESLQIVDGDILKMPIKDKTFVYLNFMGFDRQLPVVRDYLCRHGSAAKPILISFSARDNNVKKEFEELGDDTTRLYGREYEIDITRITGREDFVSYSVIVSKCSFRPTHTWYRQKVQLLSETSNGWKRLKMANGDEICKRIKRSDLIPLPVSR